MSPTLLKCEDEHLPSVAMAVSVEVIEYKPRRRRVDPKIILESDLEGGPLQALGDIQ